MFTKTIPVEQMSAIGSILKISGIVYEYDGTVLTVHNMDEADFDSDFHDLPGLTLEYQKREARAEIATDASYTRAGVAGSTEPAKLAE